ncbi:MAG: hypothetical protein IT233_07975 [Bacteroidia bacterium]|nr:hypothetical protein [Bacteroidia bacterium]
MRSPLLVIVMTVSVFLSAQSIREEVLIQYPSRSTDASSGKKVITVRVPESWVFSDSAVVALLKTLAASNDPYYLMDPSDSSRYIAKMWKRELAPDIYQFIVSEHYPDGYIKRYDVLNERGRKNGTHLAYWKQGVVKETGAYSNGKPDDQWQRFDSTGKLTMVQKFSAGEKESERILKRPHANGYSSVVARTPVKPYLIVPYSVLKGNPPAWQIHEEKFAQVWSLYAGGGIITAPGMFNMNYPSLLGKPENQNITATIGLQLWDPAKWFAVMEYCRWMLPFVSGEFQGSKVKAGVESRYFSFAGGRGFLSRPRSSFSGMLGITLGYADVSSRDLDEPGSQGKSYFELSSLKQGPMITPALGYDLRFRFKGTYTPGLQIKAGYHVALSNARWHLLDSPLTNREDVDMSGFFVTAAVKIIRLRRV